MHSDPIQIRYFQVSFTFFCDFLHFNTRYICGIIDLDFSHVWSHMLTVSTAQFVLPAPTEKCFVRLF